MSQTVIIRGEDQRRLAKHLIDRAPTGIDYVIKNGVVVVEDGRFLGKTLGKSVRRFGSRPR